MARTILTCYHGLPESTDECWYSMEIMFYCWLSSADWAASSVATHQWYLHYGKQLVIKILLVLLI